jgi:hypothetical protein
VDWIASERFTGTYMRQLSLGDGVDADHISATYHNGVLTVSIPVAEKAKPRRIGFGSGRPDRDRGIPGAVRSGRRRRQLRRRGPGLAAPVQSTPDRSSWMGLACGLRQVSPPISVS